MENSHLTTFEVISRFITVNEETQVVDVSNVFSKGCFELWLKTRTKPVKHPAQAFHRVLSAHLSGRDTRRPFAPNVESAFLALLRSRDRNVWEEMLAECGLLGSTGANIGKFKTKQKGFHEKEREKSLPNGPGTDSNSQTPELDQVSPFKRPDSSQMSNSEPKQISPKPKARKTKRTSVAYVADGESVMNRRAGDVRQREDVPVMSIPTNKLMMSTTISPRQSITAQENRIDTVVSAQDEDSAEHDNLQMVETHSDMTNDNILNSNLLVQNLVSGFSTANQLSVTSFRDRLFSTSITSQTPANSRLESLNNLLPSSNSLLLPTPWEKLCAFLREDLNNMVVEVESAGRRYQKFLLPPAVLYLLQQPVPETDQRFQWDFHFPPPHERHWLPGRQIGKVLIDHRNLIYADADQTAKALLQRPDIVGQFVWSVSPSLYEVWFGMASFLEGLFSGSAVWRRITMQRGDGTVALMMSRHYGQSLTGYNVVEFQDVSDLHPDIVSRPFFV